jgi:hypothetical protein
MKELFVLILEQGISAFMEKKKKQMKPEIERERER